MNYVSEGMRIAVSAPYHEGAINALAEAASRNSQLVFQYVPSKVLARLAGNIAGWLGHENARDRLHRQMSLAAHSRELDRLAELFRLTLSVAGPHSVKRFWMYASKIRFDERVARELHGFPGLIIGMPAACLRTFQGSKLAYKVLHQVDSHPDFHNETLLQYFSRDDCQGELVPKPIRDRIVQEAAVCDTILVPSSLVARQYVDRGCDRTRLLVMHYGANLQAFRPDCSIVRVTKRPSVLYVGQISYRKGISQLMAAVKGLQLDLILIGPMVSKAVLKNAPGNVTYLGPRGRPQVIRAMQVSDCFVLPSLEDACALVVAEAIACGLPVITTTANGASELLNLEFSTLIAGGDVAALRDALASVVVLDHDDRASRHATSKQFQNQRIVDWSEYGDTVISKLSKRAGALH